MMFHTEDDSYNPNQLYTKSMALKNPHIPNVASVGNMFPPSYDQRGEAMNDMYNRMYNQSFAI